MHSLKVNSIPGLRTYQTIAWLVQSKSYGYVWIQGNGMGLRATKR